VINNFSFHFCFNLDIYNEKDPDLQKLDAIQKKNDLILGFSSESDLSVALAGEQDW
jgi:hypothetical protein